MRKKTNTKETTFGTVTVFEDDLKNISDEKLFKKDVVKENGSDTSLSIKTKNNDFFEEHFFGDYLKDQIKDNEKTILPDNSKSAHDIYNTKDLNFVDDLYFGSSNVNSSHNQECFYANNITTEEIRKDEKLNYIDEITFGLTEESVESIGSIQNFKNKKPNNESKLSEIPLINSQKMIQDFSNSVPQQITKQHAEISNHKIIANEVPNWDYMTLDEGAAILKKHICYFNEEQGLLAIDKPYGLPSVAGPKKHLCISKLLPALENILKVDYRLLMAHRLDQNTTGVMIFATNKKTARELGKMFLERKVLKQYIAITKGIPKEINGEIDIPLYRRKINKITKTYLSPEYKDNTRNILALSDIKDENGKNAITKYRVLNSRDNAALLEIQPLTGFQHQIRAHLSFGIGCPILGDHKYSHNISNIPQKLPTEILKNLKIRQSKVREVPLHLHSYRILLPEFYKSSNVFITAKIPLHFINNLKRLKLRFG